MPYTHLTLEERVAIELFALNGLTGIIQPFPGNCAVTAQKAVVVFRVSIAVPERDENCHAIADVSFSQCWSPTLMTS